jgi:hypothetical protein
MLSEAVTEHRDVRQAVRQPGAIDFSFAIRDVIPIKRRRRLRDAIEVISSDDFGRLAAYAVNQENHIDEVGCHLSTNRAWN